MAMNPNTKKTEVLILTNEFVISGYIYVPMNMRFSDAVNKFLKETSFLPVVNAEIKSISSNATLEKRNFILLSKDKIIVISPAE